MRTLVINMRDGEVLRAARATGRLVEIGRPSIFGNPYTVEAYGRPGALQRFRAYFEERIQEDASFKSEVEGLRGKVLGCYCKPLDCHGDIYVRYLDQDRDLEGRAKT